MTPRAQSFLASYGSAASSVSAATGLARLALLIQWAVETDFGAQINNANNLANIRCIGGVPCVNGFSQFPSLGAFCINCAATWRNGFYGAVLATAGDPVDVQLRAIGESPWDAGHYDNGGGPGSSLLAAAVEFDALGGSDSMDVNNPTDKAVIQMIEDIHGSVTPILESIAAVKADVEALKAAQGALTGNVTGTITGTIS